jgi:hypothetical protein
MCCYWKFYVYKRKVGLFVSNTITNFMVPLYVKMYKWRNMEGENMGNNLTLVLFIEILPTCFEIHLLYYFLF